MDILNLHCGAQTYETGLVTWEPIAGLDPGVIEISATSNICRYSPA